MIKHPTYGTLEELLEEIREDIKKGYVLRLGLQGALNWFSYEYSKLCSEKRSINEHN